ncbi:LysM peptidoglycan-binding domain-containing protein [Massilia genomosp. 1]|uniref:LysM peptidoglycan-binding domain-containing protein n=1 Tax=Massilia genomosp. 1 TaxID=2609280 RepID=A0ABX0N171_9BURK|nr:LysM domain-containing protein [Massilia genomosp. 1]NHZ66745.1 LysM peptidoglycan-binding domain-containing protein [Massilia genomosp. 1]
MTYEQWQQGVVNGAGKPEWNIHDCDIRVAVNEYNRHLAATPGYSALDWLYVKGMLWTETGAGSSEWKIKPLQIGVPGDKGMMALLGNHEGGDLIMPPAYRSGTSSGMVRTNPTHNIRAAIGYLLMRLAKYEFQSIREPGSRVEEVKVDSGDTLERIASKNKSTVEVLRELNPRANVLHKGDVIKFQKAKTAKVITGWRPINHSNIARWYNGGGDEMYVRKLDFVMPYVRKAGSGICEAE